MKEMKKMGEEAMSKPINFSHDLIWPRCKNCFVWYGPRPAVLITEPELIKEVLTKNYVYQKLRSNPLAKLAATGIASYETDKWATHRRLLNPAFHLTSWKHMLPAFKLTISEILSKWKEIVSKDGTGIDVWPYLQTLTSDAISRTAFGSNYEEGRKIFELQKEQIQLVLEVTRTIYIPGRRGNLCLPAGVQLLLPTILLHHDTEIWGDDAMQFKPERFSDGIVKATKGQMVFFPFSWGPRICIGQNFAMLEAKMAMAMILKHYVIELSSAYAHAPHPLLLQPQYGAHLILFKT
ncbi:unnamed protein product [Withania somnifera]